MCKYDVVIIGGSASGLAAVTPVFSCAVATPEKAHAQTAATAKILKNCFIFCYYLLGVQELGVSQGREGVF